MTAGKIVEKIRHDRVITSLNNPSAAAISTPLYKKIRYFLGILLWYIVVDRNNHCRYMNSKKNRIP